MRIKKLNLILFYTFLRTCFGSPPKLKVNLTIPEGKRNGYILTELKDLPNLKSDSRIRRKFKIISQEIVPDRNVMNAITRQDWLRVDDRTGTLKLHRAVDREKLCYSTETCFIHAEIVALPQKYLRFIEVKVFIDDVNDNAPVFPVEFLLLNLTENWPILDHINLDSYQAKDFDSGKNSIITYKMSLNPFFRLRQFEDENNSSHLQLYLLRKFDYETEPEISFVIQASDSGIPPKSAKLNVTIRVSDVNDNYPKFGKKVYEVTLKEGSPPGYRVIQLRATDADQGVFGKVRYILSKRNSKRALDLVKVDVNLGSVSLLQPVERGAHEGMTILLEAKDSDPVYPKIGEARLVIHVEDVNDNSPVLTINYIADFQAGKVMLPENSPQGIFIARVTSSDGDYGRNGKVELNITSRGCGNREGAAKGYFKLNKDGYLKTLQTFDRETCSRYNILFDACDNGEPRRCTSKTINVLILDENEFWPVFAKPLIQANLSEDAYLGTVVATVSAIDLDSLNGPALTKNKSGDFISSRNGKVIYSIINDGKDAFTIGEKSGKIRLKSHIDREEKAVWKLRVSARDGGSPPKENFTDVIIAITDVNDNTPKFVSPTVNFSVVYGNLVEDEPIAFLKAVDDDIEENGRISYSLLGFVVNENSADTDKLHQTTKFAGNCSHLFIVNPFTGELRFNFSSDNLTQWKGTYDVAVKATDSGNIPLSATIILRVIAGTYPDKTGYDQTRVSKRKDSLILDPFYISIILGSLAVLLIILVVGALIKCVVLNKKLRACKQNERNQGINDVKKLENRLPYDIFQPEDSTCATPQPQLMESTLNQEMVQLSDTSVCRAVSGTRHTDSDSGRGDSDLDGGCHNSDNNKDFIKTKEMKSNCGEDCRKYGHGDSCWMPEYDASYKAPVPPYRYHRVACVTKDMSSTDNMDTGHQMRSSTSFDSSPAFQSSAPQDSQVYNADKIHKRAFERRHSNPCFLNPTLHAASFDPMQYRHFIPRQHRSESPLSTTSNISPRSEQVSFGRKHGNLETVYESQSSHIGDQLPAFSSRSERALIYNGSFARVVPCSQAVTSQVAVVSQSRISLPSRPVTNNFNSNTSSVTSFPNRNDTDFVMSQARQSVQDLDDLLL